MLGAGQESRGGDELAGVKASADLEGKIQWRRLVQAVGRVCVQERREEACSRQCDGTCFFGDQGTCLEGLPPTASSERGEESRLAIGGQDLWLLLHGVPRRLWVLAEGSDSPDRSLCHLSAKEASQVAQVGRD